MSPRHVLLIALSGLAGESFACADWQDYNPPSTEQLIAKAEGVFIARVRKVEAEWPDENPFARGRVLTYFEVLDVWKGEPPAGERMEVGWNSCSIPILPGVIYMFLVAPGTDTSKAFHPAEGTQALQPATWGELDARKYKLMGH